MAHHCFKWDCKNNADYAYECWPPATFCCKIHLKEHFERWCSGDHAFYSVMSEFRKWTKYGIIKFLTKEKLKKNTLRSLAFFCITKNSHLDKSRTIKSLKELEFDLKEINDLIIKMTQASEEEEALILNTLALPPDFDAEKLEEMLQNGSDNDIKLFRRLDLLWNKKLAILNRTNNDLKTEQNFRRTCALYDNNANYWLQSSSKIIIKIFRQAYSEYTNAYQKITSLFYVNRWNLIKYNTESGKEYKRILEIPYYGAEYINLPILLPNGELFICGNRTSSIIDRNYRVRKLPLCESTCFYTGIYFNRYVYCFGCLYDSGKWKDVFLKFDLDKAIWKKLAPIKLYPANINSNIIVNGNILLSLRNSCDLLLYSIDIESFSVITYKKKKRQNHCNILINSEDGMRKSKPGIPIHTITPLVSIDCPSVYLKDAPYIPCIKVLGNISFKKIRNLSLKALNKVF